MSIWVKRMGLGLGMAVFAGACASSSGSTSSPGSPDWTVTELGSSESYSVAGLASAPGGSSVIVSRPVSTESVSPAIPGWVATGDEVSRSEFLAVPTIDGFVGFDAPIVVGAVADGFLVAASDPTSYVPGLWFSSDGVSWGQLSTTGLSSPAEIYSVFSTGTATFIVGALRVNRLEGQSPLSPMIWRSTDLKDWARVDIGARGQGAVSGIVDAGLRLLAVGSDRDGGEIWDSTDNGLTWIRSTAPEFGVARDSWNLFDVVGTDDLIVAVGEASTFDAVDGALPGDFGTIEILVIASGDGGETWVRAELDPEMAVGLDSASSVSGAGGAFWIVAESLRDMRPEPQSCYADLGGCQAYERPVLLRSQDGQDWEEIGLADLEPESFYEMSAVMDLGEGVAFVLSGGDLRLLSWPSRTSPPTGSTRTTPVSEVDLAEFPADPVIGVTYLLPQDTHCGINRLGEFNGAWWYVNGSEGAGPRIQQDWPIAGETLYGMATLVDANTIEYSIDEGEIIAIYKSSTEAPFALCD
ncbi:MAG: hypothetical protein ACC652_07040 [Acidimicrobiales bacterium]